MLSLAETCDVELYEKLYREFCKLHSQKNSQLENIKRLGVKTHLRSINEK